MNKELVNGLMNFLDSSPVNFFAVKNVAEMLEARDYKRLDASERWALEAGGKYYTVQNSSALIAFEMPQEKNPAGGFKIISAHSDSPGFRIKPRCEMVCENRVVKLNTEVYGGPILYTWFDRPLSIAGRVILRTDNPLHPETRLLKIERPLLTIPHLAIHFNRAVNEGNPLSKQKDMLPVIALINEKFEADNLILKLIAEELGVEQSQILDFDMSLYDTTKSCLLGLNDEFITSGRIDDLSMVHAATEALLASQPQKDMVKVMAVFDNEETGSGTKQGAASPILRFVTRRITDAMGGNAEDWMRAIDKSFMVSADNAHALHPNYVEKQDPTNHPMIGGGPVIKINANCKYMTDADSAAVFRSICEKADVPYQYFVNHSDVAGGSTLGNILTSQLPLRGVDMGAAIWAMHSVRETAGVADHGYITRAFTTFYDI